jgi:hypothetical protein
MSSKIFTKSISNNKAKEITEVIAEYKKKYSNIYVICSIIALILSWNCNKGTPIYLKILYSLIAIILSYWYLLFYLVYYIYLNKNCSDEITFDINFNNINFNDLLNKLYPQNQ